MNVRILENNSIKAAVIESSEVIITDVQSAVDLIATIRYTTPCDSIIIDKKAVSEMFFDLKTGLAGDVLQKFVNYRMTISIIGDFSSYNNRSLDNFIYECNEGKHILFSKSREEAMELLAKKL